MKYILIFFLLCSQMLSAQTKVYLGQFPSMNSWIYEINTSQVLKVNNAASKVPILFRQGKQLYYNERRSFTDVKCTVVNNQIFKGNSSSTFDILFTLKDGKLYAGDGNFGQQILYTLEDGKIYMGDSNSTFDLLMTYELASEEDLIVIAAVIAPY